MSDANGLPSPQKLYKALIACSSPAARAGAALEFLRSCTHCTGGYLFLARGDEVSLAASTTGQSPADMLSEVRRIWDRELEKQSDDSSAKTIEINFLHALREGNAEGPLWCSAGKELFERRLLSIYRGESWIPIGIAMLRSIEGRALAPVRQVHLEALCNALLDAGDVTSRRTALPPPR
jgi:hypothetical protein